MGMTPLVDAVFPFWPPSVNHGWRSVGNSAKISEAGRDFRREIKKYALILRAEKKLPREPLLGDLEVRIILYPPDRKVRDLDNYFKAPLDAMTHSGVWKDDSQIQRLSDEWGERCKGGGFRIIIKPFVDGPTAD